jgi:hypothetical protein
LGSAGYARYVDDWVAADDSVERLREFSAASRAFLARDRLVLTPLKTRICRSSEGVRFAGFHQPGRFSAGKGRRRGWNVQPPSRGLSGCPVFISPAASAPGTEAGENEIISPLPGGFLSSALANCSRREDASHVPRVPRTLLPLRLGNGWP